MGPIELEGIQKYVPEQQFWNLRALQLESLIERGERSGYSRPGWIITSRGRDLLDKYEADEERRLAEEKSKPKSAGLPLGPTLEEWLANGYKRETYPPKGYAPR